MPKETVQDTSGSFDVKVGWRPDGDVQVGVETAAGHSLVTKLYGDEMALDRIGRLVRELILGDQPLPMVEGRKVYPTDSEVGRQVLDIVEASQSSPGETSYTAVWANLSRHAVNQLIRMLRKARESAYGRDE